jgi:hypothetical protein
VCPNLSCHKVHNAKLSVHNKQRTETTTDAGLTVIEYLMIELGNLGVDNLCDAEYAGQVATATLLHFGFTYYFIAYYLLSVAVR